jgi:sulfatase maturation enzyme AslB (radical SAM superfamily)
MPAPWPLASVSLALTGACNLRCAYCYQAAKPPGQMRWPTARAAIEHLWLSTSPSRRIVLTGGEPLLAYPLVKRVVERARGGDPLGRSIDVTVLTNGTALTPARAAFFARHDVSLQLSFDGVPQAQALRGRGTHARLDALVDRLHERHRAWFARCVSVAVVVPPESIQWLADSIEYLMAKRIRSIAIAPAMGDPAGWHDGLRPQLDEQFARLAHLTVAHHRRTGRVPIALFRPRNGPPRRLSQPMCGVAGGGKITVAPDGEVYGCIPAIEAFQRDPPGLLGLASSAMHLGHVDDHQLTSRLPAYREALRASGLFGSRRALHSSYGECRTCIERGRCVVCPLSIASGDGHTDPTRVPDYACAFNRTASTYRRRVRRQFTTSV